MNLKSTSRARLVVANSETCADMLYAVGIFVPDPFIWFEHHGRTYVVMNDLEIDRARQSATVDVVLPYRRYVDALKKNGLANPSQADVVRYVLRTHKIRSVEVPSSFPMGLAQKLSGVRLHVFDPFFPERIRKSAREIKMISNAQMLAEHGMQAALGVIRKSRIGRDGFLYWRKNKLTSEFVQGVINARIASLGGVAAHTIVAGGNQACDPHETGHGPLRAHQTIILDIFPRDTRTGYFGDLTRTVVRGRAHDRAKLIYQIVEQAQSLVFERLRPGINARTIHESVQHFFEKNGFTTGVSKGRMQGFFHGTGHGLGLEIHESPRISAMDAIIEDGHVITVEPGLYYPGLGGVRLEDIAWVTATGARNLTRCPKRLEI